METSLLGALRGNICGGDAGTVYPKQGVFASSCILLRFPSLGAVW